ncbi:MAG: HAMP domain-containing histidine kinase [Oscillatoria sp. SIO1A7]|nr:HAMP domain-containing histidine kinase [Oscillatoria sp. SIO1A7]
MALSNWVDLGVGLGLGVGIGWLFRSRQAGDSTPPQAEAISDGNEEPPQAELIQSIQKELKQTTAAYGMAAEMCGFKAGFLARVAHELRSPINGLIGSHQLILSDLCDDPAEEREVLNQANQSALQMVEMLDRILDVARTEHGSNPLTLEALQLAQVFEEVYYLTNLQAANRNISLKVLAPDPNLYVCADERWLVQVLVNLVDEAINPATYGSISINAQASPDTKFVWIWIDAPYPDEIWSEAVDLLQTEPGLDPPGRENGRVSLGLSLFMNHTIMELMQGRLEAMEIPPSVEAEPNIRRIQCSLPLTILEPAIPEQEGD